MSAGASATLPVRLQPRASREGIVGLREDGVLVARVSAPPVDGRANEALCRLVARHLGVAPSRVSVVRGDKSRDKLLRVEGLDAAGLQAALAAAAG
jgi:uncharacterized protein (TIGR00251 family)